MKKQHYAIALALAVVAALFVLNKRRATIVKKNDPFVPPELQPVSFFITKYDLPALVPHDFAADYSGGYYNPKGSCKCQS